MEPNYITFNLLAVGYIDRLVAKEIVPYQVCEILITSLLSSRIVSRFFFTLVFFIIVTAGILLASVVTGSG
jgi:hypothetical protein